LVLMRSLPTCLVSMVLLITTVAPAQATKITRRWYSDFTPEIVVLSDHTQNAPLISGGYLSWLDTRNNFHDAEGRILPRLFMKNLANGEEKPCSAFTRKTSSRSMYRNVSVWAESVSIQATDDNFDIVSYDFTTGTRKPICTDRKKQDAPQISKDWVIWRDWRNCEVTSDDRTDCEVYGASLSDMKEFLIKPKDTPGTAELFGDYVVLSTKNGSKQDYDIYLFVLSSKRMIPICTAPGDQYSPRIIGNTIIWLDCRTCANFNDSKSTSIFGYSLSTKKELTISTQTSREYGLSAGDRYAAWFYQPQQGFCGMVKTQIKGYDTLTSQSYNITPQPGIYRNINVSGKYCIYELVNPVSSFGSDIMVFDFTTGKTLTVFKGFGNQRNPRIYGDYAVWEDHGQEGSESVLIWGANLSNPAPKPEPSFYGYPPTFTWSSFRGDSQRTGFSNSNLKKLPENQFRIQWVADVGDAIYSTPVFDSRGNAYFGTDGKKFMKINVYDGSLVWEFQPLGRVKASAAIYRDRIFFGDEKGTFYCLNMETGQEIWRYQTGGPIMSSPVAFQHDTDHYGCVAFVSFDKKLYLFNALSKTPLPKWTLDLGGWSVTAPSVDYNPLIRISDSEPASKVIYVTTSNNRILCVSVSTGKILSEASTKSAIETSPVAFGSSVLVCSTDGIISGLDFNAWNQNPYLGLKEDTNHPLCSTSLFDPVNNMLIYEGAAGEIKFMDNKKTWTYNLGDSMKTSPALLFMPGSRSSALVACSDTGKIAIVETSTGKELTKINLSAAITTSPAIFDTGYPAILIGTIDHKLYCISQRPQLDD